MSKNKALNVYVVLDRSGSMSSQWKQSITMINEYVNGLKTDKVEGSVSVTAFDTGSDGKMSLIDMVENQSIAYFDSIRHDGEIQPRGMTPLYDAAATVMNRALDAKAPRTVIVIMTDGDENASKEYTQAKVKALVEKCQSREWEVLFLGANFDVARYTSNAGLSAGKTRNFDPTNQFDNARMFNDIRAATTAYAVTGKAIDLNVDVNVNVNK